MAVKILFGAFGFGSRPEGEDQKYLDILTEHGVQDLDTAHIYVSSELICPTAGDAETKAGRQRKGTR
jgi:aryl-alcohol dehydrogenase-like predicted oxidoreductase